MRKTETLIIGGGLAGLHSAHLLQQRDKPFLLLEAQSNFGGRVAGLQSPSSPSVYNDLGATWFWPHQKKIQNLIGNLGLPRFEQFITGDALYQLRGQNDILRHHGAGTMLSYRVAGGAYKIIETLQARLDPISLMQETAVSKLEFVNGHWYVTAGKLPDNAIEIIQAKNIVLAIPPRQICKQLNPEGFIYPKGIDLLNSQPTWMAAQAKFIATYPTAFWRQQNLSGDAFSQIGPMVEIHDASATENSHFALFGFLGMPAQQRLRLGKDTLITACLAQLQMLFGEKAATPEMTKLQDWQDIAWINCELDSNETPRHPEDISELIYEHTKHDNIYFANSEFSSSEPGYLEGAIEASDRAMQRLLQRSTGPNHIQIL